MYNYFTGSKRINREKLWRNHSVVKGEENITVKGDCNDTVGGAKQGKNHRPI